MRVNSARQTCVGQNAIVSVTRAPTVPFNSNAELRQSKVIDTHHRLHPSRLIRVFLYNIPSNGAEIKTARCLGHTTQSLLGPGLLTTKKLLCRAFHCVVCRAALKAYKPESTSDVDGEKHT